MLTFGLLIGGILAAAGIATYIFAPMVGPNPIFGVRIGYAYANRETWDKTNRFGGGLFALVGVGTAILGLLLQFLNVAARDGMGLLAIAMIAALVGAAAWAFVYARSLAQGTALAREIAPVRFRWAYLVPVVVTFALLVALAVYVYPALSPEHVATHFNINEQADGWQTRDEFLATFLGMAVLFVVLNALVVLIATREPLIAFGRWGMTWRLDPERGLLFAGFAFALINLIFGAVLWNVAAFNVRGVLAFPFSFMLWMIVPLIAIIVAMFFALARRETRR
ncbi:MAG: SdpI family protein [Chloroflexota bacterium]|nr:SdpI family protein [Chloroflexota bacterium]